MKSTQPLKIAEIGCADGRLGYKLAEITGSIKAESQLCLIDNIFENKNNICDLLTKTSALPVMSMLFSSCENTNLAFDCFDIVVINGSATFDNPYGVVREAVRIARNGGTIICSSASDYLLESTFKLVFSEREEYSLSPMDIIMTATKESVWL